MRSSGSETPFPMTQAMATPPRSFASDTAGCASVSGRARGRSGSETTSLLTLIWPEAATAENRRKAKTARCMRVIRKPSQQRRVLARIGLVHQVVDVGEDRLAVRLRPVIAVGAVRRA